MSWPRTCQKAEQNSAGKPSEPGDLFLDIPERASKTSAFER